VRLRYLEDWPLAEIAAFMLRSKFSVAGLIKRGLVTLRGKIQE
jgi:DNA-directed RNA polymerase specialized sigma24 family protein